MRADAQPNPTAEHLAQDGGTKQQRNAVVVCLTTEDNATVHGHGETELEAAGIMYAVYIQSWFVYAHVHRSLTTNS